MKRISLAGAALAAVLAFTGCGAPSSSGPHEDPAVTSALLSAYGLKSWQDGCNAGETSWPCRVTGVQVSGAVVIVSIHETDSTEAERAALSLALTLPAGYTAVQITDDAGRAYATA